MVFRKISQLVASTMIGVRAHAAPTLNLTDFIASPSYATSFEDIPNNGAHYTGGLVYTTDNIKIEQVDGDPVAHIWINRGGMEGANSWYPNGGDSGYTSISTQSGQEMEGLSFLVRTGGSFHNRVQYALFNDGVSVLEGFSFSDVDTATRLGFDGGGFDMMFIRSTFDGVAFGDGARNALEIDGIKIAAIEIPEPASMLLVGLGLVSLFVGRRRDTLASQQQ